MTPTSVHLGVRASQPDTCRPTAQSDRGQPQCGNNIFTGARFGTAPTRAPAMRVHSKEPRVSHERELDGQLGPATDRRESDAALQPPPGDDALISPAPVFKNTSIARRDWSVLGVRSERAPFASNNFEANPVPEPATLLLVSAGAALTSRR